MDLKLDNTWFKDSQPVSWLCRDSSILQLPITFKIEIQRRFLGTLKDIPIKPKIVFSFFYSYALDQSDRLSFSGRYATDAHSNNIFFNRTVEGDLAFVFGDLGSTASDSPSEGGKRCDLWKQQHLVALDDLLETFNVDGGSTHNACYKSFMGEVQILRWDGCQKFEKQKRVDPFCSPLGLQRDFFKGMAQFAAKCLTSPDGSASEFGEITTNLIPRAEPWVAMFSRKLDNILDKLDKRLEEREEREKEREQRDKEREKEREERDKQREERDRDREKLHNLQTELAMVLDELKKEREYRAL